VDLTPKQQTSEAIRQAETILITTGQRPNVDQVAASLSLAAILRKFGKKVSVIISDPIPGPASWMDMKGVDTRLSGLRDFILKVNTTKVEVDSLRYEPDGDHLKIYITPFQGGFAPSDVTFDYGDYHYDLAIILGVPQRAKIDRVFTEHAAVFAGIPVVNMDFHRINENYGAINLIEPTASSISEMLVATSESLQTGLIDAGISTMMLGGIMAATDRFTALHTTSKSLTVAAQMMAAGADQALVVRGLFGGPKSDNSSRDRNDQGRTTRNEAAGGPYPARNTAVPVAPAPVIAAIAQVEMVKAPVIVASSDEESHNIVRMPQDYARAEESAPIEPLIEPNHIELMSAEMAHEEPAEHELPPIATNELPMADFTAAAEILRNRSDNESSAS
jgi:hypothetical protein